MAGVEAELSNVKKLLSMVLEFVERIGFKAQLEKFLNQKIDKVKKQIVDKLNPLGFKGLDIYLNYITYSF